MSSFTIRTSSSIFNRMYSFLSSYLFQSFSFDLFFPFPILQLSPTAVFCTQPWIPSFGKPAPAIVSRVPFFSSYFLTQRHCHSKHSIRAYGVLIQRVANSGFTTLPWNRDELLACSQETKNCDVKQHTSARVNLFPL